MKARKVVMFCAITIAVVAIAEYVLLGYVLALNNGPIGILDVEIQPRDAKLCVGEMRTFTLSINNGTPPFSAKWYVNNTYYGSGMSVNFSFAEANDLVTLSVLVKDAHGNSGFDSVFVYDPDFKVYLHGKDQESLPCIELPDGTLITEPEILYALIKALIQKGLITQQDIKNALPAK
jgi:hypothetical protein